MAVSVSTSFNILVQSDPSVGAPPLMTPMENFKISGAVVEGNFSKVWDGLITINPGDVDVRVDNPLISTQRIYMNANQPFLAKFVPPGGSPSTTPALAISAGVPVILPAAVGGVYLSGNGYAATVQCAGLG